MPNCHYCPAEATTRDHIVPKALMRQRELRGLSGYDHLVPACEPCNIAKDDSRSTCECAKCHRAWVMFGPLGWASLPRVDVAAAAAALVAQRERRQRGREQRAQREARLRAQREAY